MVTIYNAAKQKLLDGTINLSADTIKVALYNDTVAYSPDIDNEVFVNHVLDGGTTAAEFSGSGYSRKTISSKTFSTDTTDDEGVFDAADISWSSLDGETIQGALIYRQVGTDDSTPGDDDLLFVIDDSSNADLPLTTNGGQVDLAWSSEGVLNLQ